MSVLKAIVFSKDRPLQLQAYLESLFFCTNVQEDQVYIIIPREEEYKKLIEKFPDINWTYEWWFGSFDRALRFIVDAKIKQDDAVLFGCDDVTYIRMVNLDFIPKLLIVSENELLGFSLRLGTNIIQKPINQSHDKRFFVWQWRNTPGHWGYPFELMSSVYRGKVVKEIVTSNPDEMKSPNHLESYGVMYCIKNSVPEMVGMLNTNNYAVAQDVNRVQNYFQNKFTGTNEQEIENLKDLFEKGCRLDWTNLFGIVPSDVFVGNRYWRVNEQT